MSADELDLWRRWNQGDEEARKALILSYLPLVDVQAKRLARLTGADWQDLRQDGTIGLIRAVARFDPDQGVPFRLFAKPYICGAIYDSSALTRDLARRQEEIYRKVRQTEAEMTQTLLRNPTIEEVAAKADLTVDQIRNALDARGIAFPNEFSEDAISQASHMVYFPQPERAIFLLEALAMLSTREQEIINLYYWADQSHEEIAQTIGLKAPSVKKTRQRAINKLRALFDIRREGAS